MILSLWVLVCLCKSNWMAEIMWLVQTQSLYHHSGNLNGGLTRIFIMRIRQSSISFSGKTDLVDINVPDVLLCPLLWLLCHCISFTNKLDGVNVLLAAVFLLLQKTDSCFPFQLVKVTFSTLKLTNFGNLQDGK